VYLCTHPHHFAGCQGGRKHVSCGPRDHGLAGPLYQRYAGQLYRYCLGQLRSREDAEDAVQNTFLRAHAALTKGVVPDFEAAWLYKIAHNVCLSRRLSTKRRSRVESPQDFHALEERVAAPDCEHDDLVGLDDALARMPEKLRLALLLREWQGLRYSEIAEALGVSLSAVETLIFRARRCLARELETYGQQKLSLAS
jgi:RNA polymerase sigma factor (sigma-70 family)